MSPSLRAVIRSLTSLGVPFAAGIIFALAVVGISQVYKNSDFKLEQEKKSYRALGTEERSAFWGKRIGASGGQAAYDELQRLITPPGTMNQHTEGHIFGRALYKIMGRSGVAVCDSRFAYACFHSFMTQAIQKEGTAAAQELYTACKEILGAASDNCEHGIGHGIQSMHTYDIDGLKKSLAVCDALSPRSHPVAGCMGGVFMEYNTRDMGDEGAGDKRPFVLKEVLEPCASLSGIHRGSCAHWQVQWWIRAAPEKSDGPALATALGAWCKQMPGGETAYLLCLEGITRDMKTVTAGMPSLTADRCARVTSDPDYRYTCQRQSATRFAFYYPLEKALQACDGLPDEQLLKCRELTAAEDKLLRSNNAKYDDASDKN